jgi:zinc protease
VSKATANEVIESRLSNGLEVLLKEDHTAPIVSFWTWYRVGSRNELPGKTGVSHWVEHMQFKGTPRLGKGQIFRDVSRVGGTLNAMTSQDWTAYFETLPTEHLDLALSIESDRMANSIFDPAEVESERTVILSERQGAENQPGYALYEEVTGNAFQAHPYRHMVIGYESDLRRMTRDDLFNHYRANYAPANAFIVAVGAFDSRALLERIETYFGDIPAGREAPRDIGIVEPVQPSERRTLLRRPAGAPYMRIGFHAPGARDGDMVPLLAAEAVLSGGQPMGFGGGGSMGRSSRLYRALVASGIARTASCDMGVTIDPYLFQFAVTGLPDTDLALVERTIDEELARLGEELVSQPELDRAIRQLEAQFVYSSEGMSNQVFWLGQWHIVDSWTRALSLRDEFRAVSAEDIQRVVQRFLTTERRTVGWLIPTKANGGGGNLTEPSTFAAPLIWGLRRSHTGAAADPFAFQRAELSNGVPVLAQHRPDSRSIVIRVRLAAGSIWDSTDRSGLAYLTARAALRGSGGQSFTEISERTDTLGSSLTVDAGQQFVEARVRCLRDDFAEMTQLLAQTLHRPDFPAEEVEKVRSEQLGAIAEADNDTRATADRLVRRTAYPRPNPLGRRALGNAAEVSALDSPSVRAFHERTYVPRGASVAVVGGFESFQDAVDILNESFANWSASPRSALPSLAPTLNEAARETALIAGKSQADLAVGIPTISRTAADYYPLDVANLILGRLGLMGRLGAEVRDRQGLAYYAFSQLEPRRDGSLWIARAGVDPQNVEKSLDAIKSELGRLRSTLVAEEEIQDAKTYLVGSLRLTLESHDGVASALLSIEEFDLGLDYLQRYPGIIEGISRDDIRESAHRHLDPTRLATAVAQPG